MSNPIIIFTDGSSRGNPGPGGFAAVIAVQDDKRVIEIGGHEPKTTNNRMELQAVIESLLAIRQFPGEVVINTDSAYVINGITKWVKGWIKNGWVTATKEQVLNRDLWELLTSLLYERAEKGDIDWKHISGHSGIPGNERCDVIATAFADAMDEELYDGAIADYPHDLFRHTHDNAKKAEKDSKRAHSRAAAHSYLSMVDGKIEKHDTWRECEDRVKGKSNTKFKKAISAEDEKKIISEWEKLKK